MDSSLIEIVLTIRSPVPVFACFTCFALSFFDGIGMP